MLAVDEGAQTAFYYEDPDRNSIELNVSNFNAFEENWTSIKHTQTSPDSANRPLGVDIDQFIAAREADASPWEIHKRVWTNEFASANPYNPLNLLWWQNSRCNAFIAPAAKAGFHLAQMTSCLQSDGRSRSCSA